MKVGVEACTVVNRLLAGMALASISSTTVKEKIKKKKLIGKSQLKEE